MGPGIANPPGSPPPPVTDPNSWNLCRDFYTLKNYWKTVNRRWKESQGLFMYRLARMEEEGGKGRANSRKWDPPHHHTLDNLTSE